jgi:hypothetical protein
MDGHHGPRSVQNPAYRPTRCTLENRKASPGAPFAALLALATCLSTADTVAVRVSVGVEVDVKQSERGTGISEFAVALRRALLRKDADALHASTIRRA